MILRVTCFYLRSFHRTIMFDEVCFGKGQTTDELQHMRDEQRRQEEIRSSGSGIWRGT